MHIASLERERSRDVGLLQAARAAQIKAVHGLEAKLKQEQSTASTGTTSGTGR